MHRLQAPNAASKQYPRLSSLSSISPYPVSFSSTDTVFLPLSLLLPSAALRCPGRCKIKLCAALPCACA